MSRILFLAAFLSVALLTGCVFIGADSAYLQDNTEADQSAGDDAVASDTVPDQHGPDVATEDTPTEDTPLEDTPLEDTPLEDVPGPDSGVDTIENLCLAGGGTCMIPLPDEDGDGCPDAYTPAGLSGCGDMEICCVPIEIPCVPEGKGFESFETDGVCCPGLVPVDDCFYEDGGCACPNCPCFVCTACGNGQCGPGENVCNCPEDCDGSGPNDCLEGGGVCEDECPPGWGPVYLAGCSDGEVCCLPEDDCLPAGETVSVGPDSKDCCPGLSKIGIFEIDDNGECVMLIGGMVCSDCGNGYCEEWESICSCPEDCPGTPPPPLDCYPAFPDCPDNSYCKLPPGMCYQEGAWGMCTVIPEICTWLMNPVCGCDHVTYDNECLMEIAQQSMDYPGVCDN